MSDIAATDETSEPAPKDMSSSRSRVLNTDPIEMHLLVPVANTPAAYLVDAVTDRRTRRYGPDELDMVDHIIAICRADPAMTPTLVADLERLERYWPDTGFTVIRERVLEHLDSV